VACGSVCNCYVVMEGCGGQNYLYRFLVLTKTNFLSGQKKELAPFNKTGKRYPRTLELFTVPGLLNNNNMVKKNKEMWSGGYGGSGSGGGRGFRGGGVRGGDVRASRAAAAANLQAFRQQQKQRQQKKKNGQPTAKKRKKTSQANQTMPKKKKPKQNLSNARLNRREKKKKKKILNRKRLKEKKHPPPPTTKDGKLEASRRRREAKKNKKRKARNISNSSQKAKKTKKTKKRKFTRSGQRPERKNPYQHLGQTDFSSPSFQTLGYGGYGYNTDLVDSDDEEPEIVRASKMGYLEVVQRELAGSNNAKTLRQRVNQTKKWTECDYRMSGFVKTYRWHDITAVTAAALFGHDQILYYLLSHGLADPTLKGCPTENVYINAFDAQKRGISKPCGRLGNSSQDYARCGALLAAAKPFWNTSKFSDSGAHAAEKWEMMDFECDSSDDEEARNEKDQKRMEFEEESAKRSRESDTNKPTNIKNLRKALAHVMAKVTGEAAERNVIEKDGTEKEATKAPASATQ
jgi:hypothetical protein